MPRIRKERHSILSTIYLADFQDKDKIHAPKRDFFLDKTRSLLDEHNLFDWNIKLSRESRVAGRCFFKKKQLSFSKFMVYNDSISFYEKINIVFHEMAHALVGHIHGHNEIWRQKAIELGGDGEKYHHMVLRTPTVNYQCQCGDLFYSFYRKSNKLRWCDKCQSHAVLQ